MEKIREYAKANDFLSELAEHYSKSSQSNYKITVKKIEENKKYISH